MNQQTYVLGISAHNAGFNNTLFAATNNVAKYDENQNNLLGIHFCRGMYTHT